MPKAYAVSHLSINIRSGKARGPRKALAAGARDDGGVLVAGCLEGVSDTPPADFDANRTCRGAL